MKKILMIKIKKRIFIIFFSIHTKWSISIIKITKNKSEKKHMKGKKIFLKKKKTKGKKKLKKKKLLEKLLFNT